MKCLNHPEVEAEALCTTCNSPICSECRISLRDRDYCCRCLEERVGTIREPVEGGKSTLLTFLLSLMPGAGYMYLGLMNRGLQTMIIFFGTIFIAEMIHIDSLIPLVLPVLLFYSVFDTLQTARKLRRGQPVEDKPLVNLGEVSNWQKILGYVLIGLGTLALLNNFIPYLFDYRIIRQLISPLLIIVLGVFILYRSLKGGSQSYEKRDD
ncbi:MAG: hypothetical protein GX295_09020 [Syntrophomonadaceae bacterium]|nr:hypothetical protein [Syntrophomonadaceae bacterium]